MPCRVEEVQEGSVSHFFENVWFAFQASARELPDTKLLPVARGTDVHKLALKVAHEVQGEFVSEIPDCCLRAVGPQAVEVRRRWMSNLHITL